MALATGPMERFTTTCAGGSVKGVHNPVMGGFLLMADKDIQSVISWLRSSEPKLAPETKEYPPNQFNFLVKLLCNTVFTPPDLPSTPIVVPDSTNKIAFGKYLADGLFNCYACHSADFKTNDTKAPERSAGYYGGGNPDVRLQKEKPCLRQISPWIQTGIGGWTLEQFRDAVKYGKNPKESHCTILCSHTRH